MFAFKFPLARTQGRSLEGGIGEGESCNQQLSHEIPRAYSVWKTAAMTSFRLHSLPVIWAFWAFQFLLPTRRKLNFNFFKQVP